MTYPCELCLSRLHPEGTGSPKPHFGGSKLNFGLQTFLRAHHSLGFFGMCHRLGACIPAQRGSVFFKAVEILFWKHRRERKQEAGRTFSEMQESEGSAVSIFLDPTHELVLQQQQDMSGEVKRKANM